MAGMLAHPFERAVEVLRFYREFIQSTPDEVNTVAGFMTTPEGVKVVAMAACHKPRSCVPPRPRAPRRCRCRWHWRER